MSFEKSGEFKEIYKDGIYSLVGQYEDPDYETINSSLAYNLIDSSSEVENNIYNLNQRLGLEIRPGFLKVKKNTRQQGVSIGGVPSGWELIDGEYRCSILWSTEQNINVGSGEFYANDVLVTGAVTLPPGEYSIRVPSLYFDSFPECLRTELSLKSADPLFPYNIRYLIEGYEYHATYTGSRPYPSKQDIWARTLSYSENLMDGDHYGIETVGDYSYIRIGTFYEEDWKKVTYDLDYRSPLLLNDELYIKIQMDILGDVDQPLSPTLHYFSLEAL